MKDITLRKKAVDYLACEYAKIHQPDHMVSLPTKHVSEVVGGYAGSLGRVANQVVQDLVAMGIDCRYDRKSSPTVFILTSR